MGPFKYSVDCKEIVPNSFLVKNFLTEEECEDLLSNISRLTDRNPNYYVFHFNNPQIIFEKMKRIIRRDLSFNEPINGNLMKMGGDHAPHTDNQYGEADYEASKNIIPGEPTVKLKHQVWSTILYLSNFKGGELVYPDYSKVFSPKLGDLVVHDAGLDLLHGVVTAEDDNRYTHTGFLYSEIDVPVRYILENYEKEKDIMQVKYGWDKWNPNHYGLGINTPIK